MFSTFYNRIVINYNTQYTAVVLENKASRSAFSPVYIVCNLCTDRVLSVYLRCIIIHNVHLMILDISHVNRHSIHGCFRKTRRRV